MDRSAFLLEKPLSCVLSCSLLSFASPHLPWFRLKRTPHQPRRLPRSGLAHGLRLR